jgi:tetratricopeptide (TPR) repeat protein
MPMSLFNLLFGRCFNPQAEVQSKTSTSDGSAASGSPAVLAQQEVHAVPPDAARVTFTQRFVQGLKSVATALSCRFCRVKHPRSEEKLQRDRDAVRNHTAHGDESMSQEQYPAALDAYQQALPIQRGLVGEKGAENPVELSHLGSLYQKIGLVHLRIGRVAQKQSPAQKPAARNAYAQALSAYQEALPIQQGLVGEKGCENLDELHNLGTLYRTIGSLHLGISTVTKEPWAQEKDEVKAYQEALKAYQEEAVKIQRNRMGDQGSENLVRLNNLRSLDRTIGLLHLGISSVTKEPWAQEEYELEAYQKALKAYQEALKAYQEALKAHQEAPKIQPNRVGDQGSENLVGLNKLGSLYRTLVQFDISAVTKNPRAQVEEALKSFEAELAIREHLVKEDSSNLDWLNDLAELHALIGQTHWQSSSVSRTEKHSGNPPAPIDQTLSDRFEAALETRRQLVKQDPSNRTWKYQLAVMHENTGDMKLIKLGAPDSALRNYEEAIQILLPLVDGCNDPRFSPLLQSCLEKVSNTYQQIGSEREQKNNLAEALQSYANLLQVREHLLNMQPTSPDRKYRVAEVYQMIGNVHRKGGNVTEALRHFEKVIEIGQRLITNPKLGRDFDSLVGSAQMAIIRMPT